MAKYDHGGGCACGLQRYCDCGQDTRNTEKAVKARRKDKAEQTAKAVKPKINSRKKGSRGELELVHHLIDRGFDARRGQQFKGSPDSPDIISDMLTAAGLHIECKRVEAGNLYKWLNQASKDAGQYVPIVMHRKSNERWVAILDLDDFLRFIHNNYTSDGIMFQTRIAANGSKNND